MESQRKFSIKSKLEELNAIINDKKKSPVNNKESDQFLPEPNSPPLFQSKSAQEEPKREPEDMMIAVADS